MRKTRFPNPGLAHENRELALRVRAASVERPPQLGQLLAAADERGFEATRNRGCIVDDLVQPPGAERRFPS